MKKIVLTALCIGAGVYAEGEPQSEAFKLVKQGLVSKKGNPAELVSIDEETVRKVEALADQGEDIKEGVDYLESRIAFDPRTKAANEHKLQSVRDRFNAAQKRRAEKLALKTA